MTIGVRVDVRWVFFSLLIVNVVYLVWRLVAGVMPDPYVPPSMHSSAKDPIVLLSEVGGKPADGVAFATAATRLCPAVGPWDSPAKADGALTKLAAQGYRGEVRSVKVQKDRLQWVFLPSYSDRAAALQVLRELQAKGVDSFIVAEGVDKNGISLGYFSSLDSANGLKVKMSTAGYPAQVRATARNVTEYWLYFSQRDIPDDGAGLRALLRGDAALSGQQTACGRL